MHNIVVNQKNEMREGGAITPTGIYKNVSDKYLKLIIDMHYVRIFFKHNLLHENIMTS